MLNGPCEFGIISRTKRSIKCHRRTFRDSGRKIAATSHLRRRHRAYTDSDPSADTGGIRLSAGYVFCSRREPLKHFLIKLDNISNVVRCHPSSYFDLRKIDFLKFDHPL